MARYMMGIDQGTTYTKAVIVDHNARIISSASVENKLYYPQPGWVEQDPEEIFSAVLKAAGEVFKNSRIIPDDIEAIGISSQLMTTIFWNKYTGESVGRAIVWQDNRSISICEQLALKDREGIEARSGVTIYPNCSATKIHWLMQNDRAIQKGLARGELLFGTVDSWLIWKLSGGAAHVTDLSNIGPSLLLNIHHLNYDEWMLRELGIPREILPNLCSSSDVYAYTKPELFFESRIPIAGDAGDQFAAVFGQGCYQPGSMMCNLGTGSSLALNTGNQIVNPGGGVLAPILWSIDGRVTRGIGSWTNVSGAAIHWVKNELGLIHDESEAEVLAARVPNNGGVYFVPAFTGLGSPYYDPFSRGTIFGITQSTTKNHILRAALEGMAYQIRDSFEAMKQRSGIKIEYMRAGGSGAKNDFLLQFLADMLGIRVERPAIIESSVMGSVFLAGLATGFWQSMSETQALVKVERRWEPIISYDEREEYYHGWKKAVERSLGWMKA
jgi:glycerol kinase